MLKDPGRGSLDGILSFHDKQLFPGEHGPLRFPMWSTTDFPAGSQMRNSQSHLRAFIPALSSAWNDGVNTQTHVIVYHSQPG